MFDSFFKSSKENHLPEQWQNIETAEDVQSAIKASKEKPVLLFKHSTRCPISTMAYQRLEKGKSNLTDKVDVFYLDLIQYRTVSNWIAEHLNITHQSPQVILIADETVVHISTHGDIHVQGVLSDLPH